MSSDQQHHQPGEHGHDVALANKAARLRQGLQDGLASNEEDRRINFETQAASSGGQARPIAGGGSEEGMTRVDDQYVIVGEPNKAQQEK